ncbi:hypothetical protein PORY_002551 [Pneumocystis oryctolagi]|uniref:Uncharacterized protein n=1 Tax=Pneumocystis oryctolagi TaxID=42067 RepID=A0ACB7CAU6_9ASCO|nr:hypothetical protein PORY_002551 [Pneumocystis oryctolagi]
MNTTAPETNFAYELLERTSTDVPGTCLFEKPWRHLHTVYELSVQSSASLILSVFGSILTGFMLNHIQNLFVFQNYPLLFILIPILLNLIGCLEMNLTSRLSTLANMNLLDTHDAQRTIISKQLILLQVQIIVSGTVSGLIAFILNCIHKQQYQKHNQLLFKLSLLIASSITTGCISSAILGTLVSLLVIFSLKLNINPDNILTPIASSFGDLISISTFAVISTVFASIFHFYSLIIIVTMSLFLGEILMRLCWKYHFDPDTHAFPILSSVSTPYLPSFQTNFFQKLLDFIATLSLIVCFWISIS